MMKNKKTGVLPEETTTIHTAIVNKIVSRFSRGNVNLQTNRYLTKETQDARKRALDQYDFLS